MPCSYCCCSQQSNAVLVVGAHVGADAHVLQDREAGCVLLNIDASRLDRLLVCFWLCFCFGLSFVAGVEQAATMNAAASHSAPRTVRATFTLVRDRIGRSCRRHGGP